MKSVAIIGAGMAGAAAARALSDAGCRVALFDKGRGVGGRMATRRGADGVRFDHGAQFFTAHDPRFAAVVSDWTAKGSAAPWGEPGWFVGVPGITVPVREMLLGLDVATGCTVTGLRREGRLWRLLDDEGRSGGQVFDAVFVTAPAPQARALIATAGERWPELEPALDRVSYAPCWALMLAHEGDPVFPEAYRRDHDPEAAIAWIARDGTKPDREDGAERQTLVVHASPRWSKVHLELSPAEAASLLLGELRKATGQGASSRVSMSSAHRWRFSMVETAMETPCLWSADLQLGIAGDGCLGGRVEAAYLSGLALAAEALAR